MFTWLCFASEAKNSFPFGTNKTLICRNVPCWHGITYGQAAFNSALVHVTQI